MDCKSWAAPTRMSLEHASGVAKLYSGGDLAIEPWANHTRFASRSDAKSHVVKKARAPYPNAPSVSRPTARNSILSLSSAYLMFSLASASEASAPTVCTHDGTYVRAHVWETVTSHPMARPREKGRVVALSGRFPLLKSRPTGSRVAETPAAASARRMWALISLWRAWRPVPRPHDKAWSPIGSSLSPQTQIDHVAISAPRRRPTAQEKAASSRRVSSLEEGRHWNKEADSSVAAARNRAASRGEARAKNFSELALSTALRHVEALLAELSLALYILLK